MGSAAAGPAPDLSTAQRYRNFARFVARPESSHYERLTAGVAGDPEVLQFLDGLPVEKRHPQLLLAAVRYLGGAAQSYDGLRTWVLRHRNELAGLMLRRSVQLNDFGRCAPVLPLLAALPQPLALLEVGASAGLCLLPDRYRYEFADHRVGPESSPVRVTCSVAGDPPLPAELPRVVWRAGVDLDPPDLDDPEDVAWLEALFWPGQAWRTPLLRAAIELARREAPVVVRGDLNDELVGLAGRAPRDATLVVLNSAVLSYLDERARERFVGQVRRLNARWISQELPFVLPGIAARSPRPPSVTSAGYVLALDGRPVAFTALHGERLDWFGR